MYGKLLIPENKHIVMPRGSMSPIGVPLDPEFCIERPTMREMLSMGIIPSISGGARGVNTAGDILTQTADGRDLNAIWTEFQDALNLFNQSRDPLVNLLTFSVTAPIEDVPQITGDDFEESSEFGVPKGIRGAGFFSMGYDFRWYDLAVRYTWQYLAEASAAQVDSLNNIALEADNRLVFSKVLKAILNNVTRVATIRQQNVNVYPFYNGDSTVPPTFKTFVHTAPHTHYLVSGGATVDSGDLKDIADHLKHHGYGVQQGSRLIMLANSAQTATIRTFRVSSGAEYDFVPAQGQPPFLLPTNTGGIQGGQAPASLGGLTVAGTYGPWTIIEEDFIPVGYILGFATGGVLQATNPVGVREHANAALRGLKLVKGRDNDYPLIDSYYTHGFGTGVRHRGAGVVLQIKASGSYDIPTAYV
jgi:hypothetical protein